MIKNYSWNVECGCNLDGSKNSSCSSCGKCYCKSNVVGEKCDTCANGYFNFPNCIGKISLTHKINKAIMKLCLTFYSV